jgi:hypothetical protein
VRLARVELCADTESYFLHWRDDRATSGMFAYADDGAEHAGPLLHATRLPEPPGAPEVVLDDVCVLHYARANAARVASKDRWYQCWERLHEKGRTALEIRRRYDWYERRLGDFAVRPCPDEWLAGYRAAGIDLAEPPGPAVFWTDWDVLRMFADHGTGPFARLDVWDFGWEALRRQGIADRREGLPAVPVERPDGFGDRLARRIAERAPRRRWGGHADRALVWAERPLGANLAALRRAGSRRLGRGRRRAR